MSRPSKQEELLDGLEDSDGEAIWVPRPLKKRKIIHISESEEEEEEEEEESTGSEDSQDESYIRKEPVVTRLQKKLAAQAATCQENEDFDNLEDLKNYEDSEEYEEYESEEEEPRKYLTEKQKMRLFEVIYTQHPLKDPKKEFCCPVCMNMRPWNYFHTAHIKARVRGGTMSMTNLLFTCWRCNSQMSNKHFLDYLFDYRYWNPKKYGLKPSITPIHPQAFENVRDIMSKTLAEVDKNGDFDI